MYIYVLLFALSFGKSRFQYFDFAQNFAKSWYCSSIPFRATTMIEDRTACKNTQINKITSNSQINKNWYLIDFTFGRSVNNGPAKSMTRDRKATETAEVSWVRPPTLTLVSNLNFKYIYKNQKYMKCNQVPALRSWTWMHPRAWRRRRNQRCWTLPGIQNLN